VLKSLLLTILPTCKVYLDEDGMKEDDEVEAHVEQAEALLVFLTTGYIGSPKCMLELTTAWQLGKPIIVIREPDARYGGLSAKAFEAEVNLYLARNLTGEFEQAALAWLQSAAVDGARQRPSRLHGINSHGLLPTLFMQGSSGIARSTLSTLCCARSQSSYITTPLLTRMSHEAARGLAVSVRRSSAPWAEAHHGPASQAGWRHRARNRAGRRSKAQ
jgi:hypothetical protein